VSLCYVKVPHDKLHSTALVLIHGHSLCNAISDESLGTASCYSTFTLLGSGGQNSGRATEGKSMANPRVSEDGLNHMRLLPRPLQTPAAHFKRRDATLRLVNTRSVCRTRHFR
jgi:hypothetical protein